MFGGPLLGVAVFLIIAIAGAWGFIKLFQLQLGQGSTQQTQAEVDHGFDPDVVYILKHDMLLGYNSEDAAMLVPGKDDLPTNAPGRRRWPTIEQYNADPQGYNASHDLRGMVGRNTRVRFIEVVIDPSNRQTDVLVRVELLNGSFASSEPVLGLHLEFADTVEDGAGGQAKRYIPRPELFEVIQPIERDPAPVQSPTPDGQE